MLTLLMAIPLHLIMLDIDGYAQIPLVAYGVQAGVVLLVGGALLAILVETTAGAYTLRHDGTHLEVLHTWFDRRVGRVRVPTSEIVGLVPETLPPGALPGAAVVALRERPLLIFDIP
jgi:hypothetical protein